ncbi:unnamed protein product, partial [Rotaria sp. Silwood1]
PNGFYFGKHNLIGSLEYTMTQARQTEHDTITLGLQTTSISAQIFRLESDLNLYSLEYEIVRGRSYIKLNLGEKQSDIYSAITHITDGIYHAIKIVRKFSFIELYVDGIRIKLENLLISEKQGQNLQKRHYDIKTTNNTNDILIKFIFLIVHRGRRLVEFLP